MVTQETVGPARVTASRYSRSALVRMILPGRPPAGSLAELANVRIGRFVARGAGRVSPEQPAEFGNRRGCSHERR